MKYRVGFLIIVITGSIYSLPVLASNTCFTINSLTDHGTYMTANWTLNNKSNCNAGRTYGFVFSKNSGNIPFNNMGNAGHITSLNKATGGNANYPDTTWSNSSGGACNANLDDIATYTNGNTYATNLNYLMDASGNELAYSGNATAGTSVYMHIESSGSGCIPNTDTNADTAVYTIQAQDSITPSLPTATSTNPVVFSGNFTVGTFSPNYIRARVFHADGPLIDTEIGPVDIFIPRPYGSTYYYSGNSSVFASGNYYYIPNLLDTSTGSTTAFTTRYTFNLTSSALATSTSATSTISVPTYTASTTCSVWSPMGCVVNSFQYMFIPNWDAQRVQWTGLKTSLSTKPPFGWINLLATDIGILTAGTTTKAFTTVDLSGLDNNVFNPLKTGMTIILWLGLLQHLYRRIKHIEL